MEFVNFWIIIGASLLGGLTPGPATLAIVGTSMARGRAMGLALAWGVTGGSLIWAIFAALGFGTLLATNQWLLEIIHYAGAAYMVWLSYKSARSAMQTSFLKPNDIGTAFYLVAWTKGALIHLTNPKAFLFWGSIFAIGLKPGANTDSITWIVVTCVMINFLLVSIYALIFSSSPLTETYLRSRRWFEATYAAFFGGAAYYILTNRPN